jgi:hypothetical protein
VKTLERRQTVGLTVAAGILVVVAVVVAMFGIVAYPDTPLVLDQPDPVLPGRLAYLTWDDGEGCLHVVDGRGNDDELTCGELGGELIRWTDTGYVAVRSWSPSGAEEWIVDPVTGEVVDVVPVERNGDRPEVPDPFQPWAETADGRVAEVSSRAGDVRVTVRDGAGPRATVWEATGPSTYRLEGVSWSPDGDWLLVRDSRGSLLVLGADGDPSPRTWAEDADGGYAWYERER